MVKKLRKIIVHIYPTHIDRVLAFQEHHRDIRCKGLVGRVSHATYNIVHGEEDHKFMTEDQVERGQLQGLCVDKFDPPQPYLEYLHRPMWNLPDD